MKLAIARTHVDHRGRILPLWCLAFAVLMTGCSSPPKMASGIENVRHELSTLQANQQLAVLAPTAITEADAAVRAAEQPIKDEALSQHRVFVADRKVNIAWAQAQSRYAEDQRPLLMKARDDVRYNQRAHEAMLAKQQASVLQAEIDRLKARPTDRGLVITLGDVLFATGKSHLTSASHQHLTDLAAFLAKYPTRSASIEGHTDSVGSTTSNVTLSQQRADSVRRFLVSRGIAASRLVSVGKGESLPISDNDSVAGRQQNRRVEVIIADQTVALH